MCFVVLIVLLLWNYKHKRHENKLVNYSLFSYRKYRYKPTSIFWWDELECNDQYFILVTHQLYITYKLYYLTLLVDFWLLIFILCSCVWKESFVCIRGKLLLLRSAMTWLFTNTSLLVVYMCTTHFILIYWLID